jgi:hypothetical protein
MLRIVVVVVAMIDLPPNNHVNETVVRLSHHTARV